MQRRHFDEMRDVSGEIRAHFRALSDWLAATPRLGERGNATCPVWRLWLAGELQVPDSGQSGLAFHEGSRTILAGLPQPD
jgi:hypothetical protein